MYGIFPNIYHKNQPNVGKYTSPMDPMGTCETCLLFRNSLETADFWVDYVTGRCLDLTSTLEFVFFWSPKDDTPRKINMEHNHGGLEDHVPF